MACRVNIISFSGGNYVHIYMASLKIKPLSSSQAWPQEIEEIEQFCSNDSVNFIQRPHRGSCVSYGLKSVQGQVIII